MSPQGAVDDVTHWSRLSQIYHKLAGAAPLASVVSAIAAVTVGAVSIYVGYRNVDFITLQQEKLAKENYSRDQGSFSLAWRTIGEANNRTFELGQSAAIIYLARIRRLNGHITLNNSSVTLYDDVKSVEAEAASPIFIDLSQSALCSTEVSNWLRKRTSLNFNNSYLEKSSLSGSFESADLLGANLHLATLDSLAATNSRFAATNLTGARFRGGYFDNADFEGANLQGATTERGKFGVGERFGGGTEYGYFSADYSQPIDYNRPFAWPLLFDKDKGTTDTLNIVGRNAKTREGDYPVDFTNARFVWADLRKAHLENSNISQKQINEACADESTTLPAGIELIPNQNCAFPTWVSERIKILQTVIPANTAIEYSCEGGP